MSLILLTYIYSKLTSTCIVTSTEFISSFHIFLPLSFAEPLAFEVLPSLKRLKQRITAAGRGEYDAVFMSGR